MWIGIIMTVFKNISVVHKIIGLVLFLSALALGLAGLGYYGLSQYQHATSSIQNASARAQYSEKINGLVYAVVMDSRGVYMARDPAEVEKFAKPLTKNLSVIQSTVSEWEKIIKPEDKDAFAALKKSADDFVKFRSEVVRLGMEEGAAAARVYGDNDQNRNNRQAFNKSLVEFAAKNEADIVKTYEHIESVRGKVKALLINSSVIGVLFALVFSFFFVQNSLRGPLRGLCSYLRTLAQGQLSENVPYLDYGNEVGDMARSVNVLRDGLLRERSLAEQAEKQKHIDAEFRGQMHAIRKSQAVIEFDMNGTILAANDHFLRASGYSDLNEIVGKHHSMFATPEHAASQEYKEFWNALRRGEYQSGEYKRIGKGGREFWINATYNPILDEHGKPFKVVKFAVDVTDAKLSNADYQGQIEAINKSQAVIHFNMDGTIIQANDIFLNFMGYTMNEIRGKHHAMFVDKAQVESAEYKKFWDNLRAGNFDARVFKRITKNGDEVWIQASYNPVFDLNGKPFKVVKYATDVTDMINLTDQTGVNVSSVARATEELSHSINEISTNMARSKQATEDIVNKVQASKESSENLVSTMRDMEEIVNLIKDIAEQVNLLALNATIEAARAGEAGKGFSVVASEVKNLATQTASATDDIAQEISKVQQISSQVANAVHAIIESADSVNGYVAGVASAIEEQSIIVKDISTNSQTTSNAVAMISESIKKTKK
ncbi:PAS domain-containing protein [Micavibrio aeruginosavorus]|uniref:Methyl-accepting chemotaxis sensory transducer with Pas/Pac sensor n=2 Tax=Micavibrio aeruginosavorus TaxID=349221 RepID=M4VXX3_9BACT|nr:methyl-accepting chemotaxis sensory transducer with Pas/Pac sensor [Micavibrio aeruginosavorus EPB]